jgi:hypothetical protein
MTVTHRAPLLEHQIDGETHFLAESPKDASRFAEPLGLKLNIWSCRRRSSMATECLFIRGRPVGQTLCQSDVIAPIS